MRNFIYENNKEAGFLVTSAFFANNVIIFFSYVFLRVITLITLYEQSEIDRIIVRY